MGKRVDLVERSPRLKDEPVRMRGQPAPECRSVADIKVSGGSNAPPRGAQTATIMHGPLPLRCTTRRPRTLGTSAPGGLRRAPISTPSPLLMSRSLSYDIGTWPFSTLESVEIDRPVRALSALRVSPVRLRAARTLPPGRDGGPGGLKGSWCRSKGSSSCLHWVRLLGYLTKKQKCPTQKRKLTF